MCLEEVDDNILHFELHTWCTDVDILTQADHKGLKDNSDMNAHDSPNAFANCSVPSPLNAIVPSF